MSKKNLVIYVEIDDGGVMSDIQVSKELIDGRNVKLLMADFATQDIEDFKLAQAAQKKAESRGLVSIFVMDLNNRMGV